MLATYPPPRHTPAPAPHSTQEALWDLLSMSNTCEQKSYLLPPCMTAVGDAPSKKQKVKRGRPLGEYPLG